MQRGVHVQVGVAGGEFEHVAKFIVRARERTIETKRDGAVGDKLQRIVINLDGHPFLGAARHQAHGWEFALPRLAERDVVSARQTAAHQHAAAGRAHIRVVGRTARHGEIELAVLQNLGAAAIPAGPRRRRHALAGSRGMKKPPLKRMASGAWPVGSRKALRWRVMAGSETYGRPSSRKRLRFSSLGCSPRWVKGRKPSSASSSASSRRISVLSDLPISAEPEPSTVISTLCKLASPSSFSLAAVHWRRSPLRWRMESGTPSLVSTSQASVRSRLSPPSSRCLPTAVRVKSTRSP